MTPSFKFLRRVRIHGGECGAVARALHHEAKIQPLPAVGENVSFTTNERKSMSTKTSTLKRIAQTAVVALLGGLMSVVAAPASNSAVNTGISGTCIARGGVGGVIAASYAGDSETVIRAAQYSLTNVAGQTTTLQTDVVAVATDSSSSTFVLRLAGASVPATAATITYILWSDRDGDAGTTANGIPAGDSFSAYVTCTVAGAPSSISLSSTANTIAAGETQTVTATPKDSAGNTTLLTTSESMTVKSFTTTAVRVNLQGGRPSNAAMTSFQNGAAAGVFSGSSYAAPTGAQNVTQGLNSIQRSEGLGATGTVEATSTTSIGLSGAHADAAPGVVRAPLVTGYNGAAQAVTPAFTAVSQESVTSTGGYSFNVSATGASSVTTVVRGAGGFATASSATHTLTVGSAGYATGHTFGSSTAVAAAGIGIRTAAFAAAPGLTAVTGNTSTFTAAADANYILSTVTGKTVSLKLHSGTSAATIPVTVAVTTAKALPTGITAGTTNYTTVGNGVETSVVISLAATAPLSGQGYTVTYKSNATTTITLTFTYQLPTVSGTTDQGTVTIVPAASTLAKNVTGGSNSVEVTVVDQFLDIAAGATVLMTRTGRNAVTSESKATDAFGKATFTWTDTGAVLTGTAGSATGTTDVVTINAQTSNATSAKSVTGLTITYSATLAATTLTLTNTGAAAGVAAGSCVSYTATVLDASGVPLVGYPIIFTGNANTYFSTASNTATFFSATTTGAATASFCGQTSGTATVTATSGGKTATSSHTVIAGTARVLSVDAATATMAPGESKRVTATVKDAFGNVAKDVALTIAYTGTSGRVASVNGITSSTGTTDTNGLVVVELSADTAGTGTLTLTMTGGNTSTAATLGNGAAQPARVASTTTAVAVEGVNASVAAAEAASDAAAEAIDAANAATDAANLAAEAADAATVAAEEARDAADAATAAVEELATQVATLMSALKAQITTLANTVAKIAKKVKA
ncbi:MAG: hypothetical protein O2896_03715 [Actinomycetota bacterium]|nr:hypothetical protein [Actinomycetota bacterium]